MDNRYDHCYDDIISLSRPVSSAHKPMPRENRAAQFSPFAALTGYDDEIKETARLTDERAELDETRRSRIDTQLQMLAECGYNENITVVFFRNDERKSGGKYVTVSGRFKKIDMYEKKVILSNGTQIPIYDIYAIDGEILNRL